MNAGDTTVKHKTALITGASSGIGAEFARQLAGRGMNLVLVARREERLAALSDALQRRYGVRAEVFVADLARTDEVKRVEHRIVQLTDLEILVNNAGFGIEGSFTEVDVEGQIDMIHVHVVATVRLTRAALPAMIDRRRGFVINVSSIAAFMTGDITYCATKTYIYSFSESLQDELRDTGVRVQALCPSYTRTGFHETESIRGFDKSRIPEWMWMPVEQVVHVSLKALGRKRVLVVPGLINRLIVRGLRCPLTRSIIVR